MRIEAARPMLNMLIAHHLAVASSFHFQAFECNAELSSKFKR
jgi:hypothetical protein